VTLWLSDHDRIVLHCDLDITLEADLRKDRLWNDDALRVADSPQRAPHVGTMV
jgi:hypothetical protein